MRRLIMIPLLAVLLAAAAVEPLDPLELVRRGNAAFANQDFITALALYEKAASRITDPGLVAQNQAAALYRLGRFREAELHYRRALEDAEGVRRGRLLFDLGNSLLQQSGGTDAVLLADALACYRQARELADVNLAEDLRHNLELAKLLWIRARASQRRPEPPEPDSKEPEPNQTPTPEPKAVQVGVPENGKQPKGGSPAPELGPQETGGKPIQTDQPPPPGSNPALQPIPDRDELVPLAREDALRQLQAADEKIQREQREHLKRSAPLPPRGLKDW